MMLQIDASPHPWLEERGPSFTLIGAIDDATGKVPYALFQEHENNRGYIPACFLQVRIPHFCKIFPQAPVGNN
jgi:hypothetical protein